MAFVDQQIRELTERIAERAPETWGWTGSK